MGESHQNSSVVDDTDPRFTYSGPWSLIGSASDHNFTSHGTNGTGSTAVLTFNGTSVIVYGTVTPTNTNGPPVSSYSIDNGPASIFTAPTTDSSLFGLQFYEAEDLQLEVHNLTITVKSVHPSEYWLDYALIRTESITDTHSSKIDDMGAMVGGPLGGLVLVLLSGVLFLWYRRHRQNRGVKIASITHRFDVRPNIDESPAEASSLSRSKTLPSVSMPTLARVAYSPPGTGSSTSSNSNTPTYGGTGLHTNHSLVRQAPYSPPGTGDSTSSYRNTYAGRGLYVSPVVPQGPYSPPGTGDSTSSNPNTPNTPTYGGPGLFTSHGLIPIDISQGQSPPSPSDPTTPTTANLTPSSDQPPRRTRGKSVPRLARPTTAPPAAPPVPRLHEDAGIRLEGGRLSDVEAMIDVPPAYREY